MRYYLVGGCVRDLLLSRPVNDYDIVFEGSIEEFVCTHPRAQKVGLSFAVHLLGGHEYAQARGACLSDDLAQRDFTMNAIALAENGVIHAAPGALRDLADGVIRHVSDTAFSDDPVRAFRAARFWAVLPEFNFHDSLVSLLRNAPPGVYDPLAPERIGAELVKAMSGKTPGNFIRALAHLALCTPWFQELAGAESIPAGPAKFHGTRSVLEHTAQVMDALAGAYAQHGRAGSNEAALAAWMGLCHDLGKVTSDPAMLPRHLGHEQRGIEAAENLAQRLRLCKRWQKAGMLAAELHMKAARYRQLRSVTKVDLLMALHTAHIFSPFTALVAADADDAGIRECMLRDRDRILAVTLPDMYRNRGALSGIKLRELRARAI